MQARAVLFAIILSASWAAGACSGNTDNFTSPSSVAPPVSRGPAPPSQALPPTSGTCDAGKAEFAVGQSASDELVERARTAAGATSARVVRPNQPITTDYFGLRLNLSLNEQDVVRSVSCG